MTMNLMRIVALATVLASGAGVAAQAQTNTEPKPQGAASSTAQPGGGTSAGPEGAAQNLRGHSDPSKNDATGSTASDPTAQNLRGHSETPKDSLKKN